MSTLKTLPNDANAEDFISSVPEVVKGDWPLTAFSPRKQNLTLYMMLGSYDYIDLLEGLGKHKTSKGCLYINKLADVDQAVLEQLIKQSFVAMKRQYS